MTGSRRFLLPLTGIAVAGEGELSPGPHAFAPGRSPVPVRPDAPPPQT